MKQLKMRRPSVPVFPRALPPGYEFEFFCGDLSQIEDWLALCDQTLIPERDAKWFESCIVNYPDLCPERDLFFVVEQSTKVRVATTAAVCHPDEGYIHMVAANKAVRGKGIGHAMLAFALDMLEKRGCKSTVLTTDDFRLAAIKTYLDAGFCPVIEQDPESDVQKRWDAVLSELGYSRPVAFIRE